MDEPKAAFANKQYPVILQQISRIQSSPKVLADYDRYDLTVLRAETEFARTWRTTPASPSDPR